MGMWSKRSVEEAAHADCRIQSGQASMEKDVRNSEVKLH